MPAHIYRLISIQIQQLAPLIQQLTCEEKLQLVADLITVIQNNDAEKPLRSILELKGLGKEIWEGIDVDQYINEERNSWERDLHNDTKG